MLIIYFLEHPKHTTRMSNNENKENDKDHTFCVSATAAKWHYFLETSDLRCLEHKAVHKGYYGGGSFKFFTPASLEQAALKKFGEGGLERKRQERTEKQERKQERARLREEKLRKEEEERELAREHRRKIERRDAAKPKKALKARELYCKEHHDEIKKNNSGLKYNETLKLTNAGYTALSEEDKKLWKKKAAVDQERYDKEYAAWKVEFAELL
jgi:hypothetical protein